MKCPCSPSTPECCTRFDENAKPRTVVPMRGGISATRARVCNLAGSLARTYDPLRDEIGGPRIHVEVMQHSLLPAAEVQEQSQDLPFVQAAHITGQRGGGIRVEVDDRIGTLANERQPEEVEPVRRPAMRDLGEHLCEYATRGQLGADRACPGQRGEVPAASTALAPTSPRWCTPTSTRRPRCSSSSGGRRGGAATDRARVTSSACQTPARPGRRSGSRNPARLVARSASNG
jgi:hypothetical protein